jgi:hypothetical protein
MAFQDISNVSDSDADNILRVIKGIIPDIAKISEVGIQKKDAFAQLPNAFSIEGLFVVPSSVGGTLIRLIGAQLEGVHARVTIIANILIQLAPVGSLAFRSWQLGTDFSNAAQLHGRSKESQGSS